MARSRSSSPNASSSDFRSQTSNSCQVGPEDVTSSTEEQYCLSVDVDAPSKNESSDAAAGASIEASTATLTTTFLTAETCSDDELISERVAQETPAQSEKFVQFLLAENPATPIVQINMKSLTASTYTTEKHAILEGENEEDENYQMVKEVSNEESTTIPTINSNRDHDNHPIQRHPLAIPASPVAGSREIQHSLYSEKVSAASSENGLATTSSISEIPSFSTPSSQFHQVSAPGRRSITLQLLEELSDSLNHSTSAGAKNINGNTYNSMKTTKSSTPFGKFSSLRRFRSLSLSTVTLPTIDNNTDIVGEPLVMDRGSIAISWYDGTTSSDMQEHVWKCVLRKLQNQHFNERNAGGEKDGAKMKLEDVRLLDDNVTPHEEVILCPFLPDGSKFLLKFKISIEYPKKNINRQPHEFHPHYQHRIPSYITRAPDSPSEEHSPHPSSMHLAGMNGVNAQLRLLNAAAALLQSSSMRTTASKQPPQTALSSSAPTNQWSNNNDINVGLLPRIPSMEEAVLNEIPDLPVASVNDAKTTAGTEEMISPRVLENNAKETAPVEMNSTDDLIEQQLRQLKELFLSRKESGGNISSNEEDSPEDDSDVIVSYYKRQEKKQVIFVIANYLVLFMSLIALSAEIQSRLPQWMKWVQENYDSVQNCATDRDALFECVSSGNFSGLVASFMLWATQSAAAKRIFLFGFDTPKKLWTVVYEAGVTAVCWGLSYLFIRRGLNPNTREKFIQKYWKDAVYGSLAGFNAAFMKAVLKNLVPQDVALEALETRQLRIFNWLSMLMSSE